MYNVEFSTYMRNTHSSNAHCLRYLSPPLISLTSYSEPMLCYRLPKSHKVTGLALIPFVMTQEKCQLPKGLVTIGTLHNCLQLISTYYSSYVDLAHTQQHTYTIQSNTIWNISSHPQIPFHFHGSQIIVLFGLKKRNLKLSKNINE